MIGTLLIGILTVIVLGIVSLIICGAQYGDEVTGKQYATVFGWVIVFLAVCYPVGLAVQYVAHA